LAYNALWFQNKAMHLKSETHVERLSYHLAKLGLDRSLNSQLGGTKLPPQKQIGKKNVLNLPNPQWPRTKRT